MVFQQYFSYIVAVEETMVPAENQWSVASNWRTLSHNAVLNTPHLSGIWTHNFDGDRHWLYKYM